MVILVVVTITFIPFHKTPPQIVKDMIKMKQWKIIMDERKDFKRSCLLFYWLCPLKTKYIYYTVRPLFKKFTQHCETYEPTNCCVKKIHNLCKIVHNLCKIVHKLCNFFTQLLVGSYVSQCCVKF